AGWGVDGQGRPTTDASAAAAGGLAIPLGAPAAPYKGYGLAMVMEALGGVLSGARFGRQHTIEVEAGPRPWDEGHFFLAFDPAMVMPIDEFKQRMDALARDVRAAGGRLPGSGGAERRSRVRTDGLRLPRSVVDRLRAAI